VHNSSQDEARVLQVVLPENYEPESDEKYSVVYIIDGEWHTELVSMVYRFAAKMGFVPPAIIVGIENTMDGEHSQRERDLLPAKDADRFLKFIADDLIPCIEQKYPTNGKRILYGHSYGGLFSTYAFLCRPELCDSYMAIDPPYHGNHHLVLKKARERIGQLSAEGKSLWIAGIEATHERNHIPEMSELLQALTPEELRLKVGLYTKESHESVAFKGAYDGFKFIYEGYEAPAS
jgi:predicted alpha/beta superfamily hydrolase